MRKGGHGCEKIWLQKNLQQVMTGLNYPGVGEGGEGMDREPPNGR